MERATSGSVVRTTGAERNAERSIRSEGPRRWAGLYSSLRKACSVIVHLHLNRYPYSLILPHPEQPVASAQSGGGRRQKRLERLREAVVHVEGRLIIHLRGDGADVQLPGRFVCLPVKAREL